MNLTDRHSGLIERIMDLNDYCKAEYGRGLVAAEFDGSTWEQGVYGPLMKNRRPDIDVQITDEFLLMSAGGPFLVRCRPNQILRATQDEHATGSSHEHG
jgi:hypothetical protein